VTGGRTSFVTSDNRRGGELAAEHLLGLGHRRIATITGPLHLLPAAERLAASARPWPPPGPRSPPAGRRGRLLPAVRHAGMQRLLAQAEQPTAVFAAGDEMAIGALRALADAGRRVPGDVSVVGYDDVEAAALVPPGLTTVAQDPFAMGRAAVALLLELMQDGQDLPPPTRLSGRLVVRGSTAPVRAGWT
jgi:LacI family transcriptional regulator